MQCTICKIWVWCSTHTHTHTYPAPPHTQVPTGETPRSLVLHLLGELTRTTKPGEVVTISGIFLPEPYTGYRAMRAGLLTSTYLRVQRVVQDKTSYADLQASCVLDDEVEVGEELEGWGFVYVVSACVGVQSQSSNTDSLL